MVDLTKAFELDNGIINGDTVVFDSIRPAIKSFKPIFTNGNLTSVAYYKSTSQNLSDRLVLLSLSYTGDNVDSITVTYYESDGTTVFSTETISISYSGDSVTRIDK